MNVSHDTIVSNKHEEQTRHYYVNFQQCTNIQELGNNPCNDEQTGGI